jgi:predicted permease
MNALLLDDLRHAIRRLRKDAGTTIASVVALACGIGAAVATWALVSAVLLNPLPVVAPEQLFQLDVPPPTPNVAARWIPGHTYPVLEAFRSSGTFEGIAAGGGQSLPVVDQGDAPQSRGVYFADRDFFATLGIRAAHGRTFAADEDRRGAPPVAVLSDRYWRTVFNADPNVLGRNVTVAGLSATIVGVLPRGFRGLHLSGAPDLYLPLQVAGNFDRRLLNNLDPFGVGHFWLQIVGRLRAGETPAGVAARLNAMDCLCGRDLTHGEVSAIALTNVNVAAVPALARAGTAQFATLLAITVGLLLLAGCLTVAMLLLVRTEDRRDELAVRLALGATRARLAVGIGVEVLALSVLGALLAVPFALWFFFGVRAFQLPGSIDIERLDLTLSVAPWLAVTGTALTATFALAAGLVGAATALHSPLQPRALATPRVARRAPRTVLIAGQVAITLVLVTGAGLFARSLIEALTLNPRIATDRVVTAFINLGPHGYTPERATTFVDELIERLRRNGAIESAAIRRGEGGIEPGLPGFGLEIDGVVRELRASLSFASVDEGFFSTLGLPIVNGRGFAAFDTAGSPPVAVVSESLGRFIADGGNPVGRRIGPFRVGRAPPAYPEVIGVVPDLITEVGRTEPLVAYQLVAQRPPSVGATLVFRSADDPRAAIREAMAATRALDSRVTLGSVMTLDEQIGRQMNPQRFGVYVLGALGGIALLLTALGTYVIAESLVVRRRRELGIRAALGARAAQLRGLVLRDTARLVGIGLVVGLALAIVGARLIRSLLYQVEPLDPLVLVTVAVGIFGLALLVSLRPALAAGRQDLVRSLREE